MNDLWEEALKIIRKHINEQNFNTWIRPIKIMSIEQSIITAEVPNKFIRDWVYENYQKIIKNAFADLGYKNFQFNININKENKIKEEKKVTDDIVKTKNNYKIHKKKSIELENINKKYTFDTFVSGPSNQFAHAAAQAVSNNPATTYNPLFIYGGVGLGKTHLINAIGNEIFKRDNNFKICYYSSEKFTNELINSLRHGKMNEFRNKFREIDILLIDDIQFIAGKKSTQEEFFHTFNALYESHKQIVVTSDKFPKEIPDLEERLRSRFEWGLIADIQSPDTETKQAILKMKADQNLLSIPEDVLYFLANSITNNIRELEGYLIRIGAFSSLTSTPIDIDMAKSVLKDILIENNREITIEKIQKSVADYFHIKISDLKSTKRLKNIVFPRQISMYISRQLTDLSYPEIGSKYGGKDHSTIIHAIKKIEKKMSEDSSVEILVEKLTEKIKNC